MAVILGKGVKVTLTKDLYAIRSKMGKEKQTDTLILAGETIEITEYPEGFHIASILTKAEGDMVLFVEKEDLSKAIEPIPL